MESKNSLFTNVQNADDVRFITTTDDQKFVVQKVIGDGDCGYNAFGIERKEAHKFLEENLDKVRSLLLTALRGVLLTNGKDFLNYLEDRDSANIALKLAYEKYIKLAKEYANHLEVDDAVEKMVKCADDLVILHGYISYDVKDKKVDFGWSHPCILQALATIRNIHLVIWRDVNGQAVPHRAHDEYDYHDHNQDAEERKDLLFTNGNHFNLLQNQKDATLQFVAKKVSDEARQNAKTKTPVTVQNEPTKDQGRKVKQPSSFFYSYKQERKDIATLESRVADQTNEIAELEKQLEERSRLIEEIIKEESTQNLLPDEKLETVIVP